MKVTVVETGKTIRQSVQSKYGRLFAVMVASLRRDGADGKLRAVEDTAVWSPAKVRRIARGLRDHYRIHRIPGFRLSLRTCAVNGITFLWAKTS